MCIGRFVVQALVEVIPAQYCSIAHGAQIGLINTSNSCETPNSVSSRSISSRIASMGKLAPLKLKQAGVKPKRKKSSKDKFSRGVATVFSGDLAKQMGIKHYFQRENNGPMVEQCDNSAQNVIGQEF